MLQRLDADHFSLHGNAFGSDRPDAGKPARADDIMLRPRWKCDGVRRRAKQPRPTRMGQTEVMPLKE